MMDSERVFVSESRASALVEPVRPERGASAAWPTHRAAKMPWRVSDGRKWPVTVRKVSKDA